LMSEHTRVERLKIYSEFIEQVFGPQTIFN
jgi:hypothetical protein